MDGRGRQAAAEDSDAPVGAHVGDVLGEGGSAPAGGECGGRGFLCQVGADGVGDGAGDESALEAGRRGFAAARGECVDVGRGAGQCRVEVGAGGLDGGGVEV